MNTKNKKIISFMLAGILSFSIIGSAGKVIAKAEESKGLDVEAKSAILLEPTSGEVLYEKNSKEKFAPESVTKVMTMLQEMMQRLL